MNDSIPDVENGIPSNAVSLYGQGEAMDDFPVLKAFQQYINDEQAKSRKRLITLGIFFGALMFVVIAVFVALLINVSNRNQALNDRLVEFAMRERNQSGPVVVQPAAPASDSSALLALTSKLEDMQKKLSESQNAVANAEKARAEADQKAKAATAKPKGPTAQELEIQRLKAMLSMEKEKAKLEAERKRQEELEAYRRKHYPELYGIKPTPRKPVIEDDADDDDSVDAEDGDMDDIDMLMEELNENTAIDYFAEKKSEKKRAEKKSVKKPAKATNTPKATVKQKQELPDVYSIPVDIKGSKTNWRIPE